MNLFRIIPSLLVIPTMIMVSGCAYFVQTDRTEIHRTTTEYYEDGSVKSQSEERKSDEDESVNDSFSQIVVGAGISVIVTILLLHIIVI